VSIPKQIQLYNNEYIGVYDIVNRTPLCNSAKCNRSVITKLFKLRETVIPFASYQIANSCIKH